MLRAQKYKGVDLNEQNTDLLQTITMYSDCYRPSSGRVHEMEEEEAKQPAKEAAVRAAKQAAMQAAVQAAKQAAMKAAMQAAKKDIDPATQPHMAQLLADRYASPRPSESIPPSRPPSAAQGPPGSRQDLSPGMPLARGSSRGPLNMFYRPNRNKIDAATMYDPYPKRQTKKPLAEDEQTVLFNYHQVKYNIRVKSQTKSK